MISFERSARPTSESSETFPVGRRSMLPIVVLAVLALTLLAAVVRLPALQGPVGRLDTDEARLALAADGVLRSGLPVMPSGRIYTRGFINSYFIAPAFALLGRNDFTARLPSVLAGALLVPVVYLLGRALGGTSAGLAAAGFTVLSDPLVVWSRNAWMPSIFVLLFTFAVFCCYKGFVERRGGWQIAGAVCFCLALLSYEFAVLLPLGLAISLGVRVAQGDRSWYCGRRTVLALGILGAGVILFGILALMLRAGTIAGPLGEVREFASPSLDLSVPGYYGQALLANYYSLIAAILLSLPALASRRQQGVVLLGILLVLFFLVPSFLIQVKYEDRYALPLLPLLAVLAAAGTANLARHAIRPVTGSLSLALPGLALLLVFGVALSGDAQTAIRRFQRPTLGSTWVQSLQQHGLRDEDILITEAPTIVNFYFGRDDFWIRDQDFERYVYQAPDALRSIYTDAILINKPGDFERLVDLPYAGRNVWVLGRRGRVQNMLHRIDPLLLSRLFALAEKSIETQDGWYMLKLTLPHPST